MATILAGLFVGGGIWMVVDEVSDIVNSGLDKISDAYSYVEEAWFKFRIRTTLRKARHSQLFLKSQNGT